MNEIKKDFEITNRAEVMDFVKSETIGQLNWHVSMLQLMKECAIHLGDKKRDLYFIEQTLKLVNDEIDKREVNIQ
jgi:hypothetical protein